MKKRVKWFSFIVIIMISFFSAGVGVLADDDDDNERYEYRGFNEEHEGSQQRGYEEADDDEEYGEEEYEEEGGYSDGYDNQQAVTTQSGFWNFWIREAISSQDTNLPIQEPGDVAVKVNGVSVGPIHIVPQNGQLLVPGEQVAKLLNAKTDFYPKSRILSISKNKTELIVRAGSNAAYENKNKTPMPIQAQYIETALYIPVSVVANSLGYRVSWNETEQSLILENI